MSARRNPIWIRPEGSDYARELETEYDLAYDNPEVVEPNESALYPYPSGTMLNWAWMATSLGAVGGTVVASAAARHKGYSATPLAVGLAALAGGWLGAKIILPA